MKQSLKSDDPLAQDFIAMIAHDLRTPVTAIKGFGQLALRQGGGAPQMNLYLKTVISEANRIAAMVDDLVLVSGIDDGSIVAARARMDLGPLLTALTESMAAMEIPVRVLPGSPAVSARGDRRLTERAVANLVRLALKHCRAHAPVYLAASGGPTDATILVTTHPEVILSGGCDAPAPTALDLRDTSRGMSAYIALILIEAQGGHLAIESLGDGICFRVALPNDERSIPGSRSLIPDP